VVTSRAQLIYNMRKEGTTLKDIGTAFSLSKERIRQILCRNYGSTRISNLLSTSELCIQADRSLYMVNKLAEGGLLAPHYVGKHRYWTSNTVSLVKELSKRTCEICGRVFLARWGTIRCDECRRVTLVCDSCGKEFPLSRTVYNVRLRRGYKHSFCSRRCVGRYTGKEFGFAKHPYNTRHSNNKNVR